MDLKQNIVKQIVENILNEAPVSGDVSAKNIAQAKDAASEIKSRLSKLGIYEIPELAGINTIDQLSIEPFLFEFVLQVPEIQEELELPKPPVFDTIARVTKKEGSFTLELKIKDSDKTFFMQFDDSELVTNIPGTKRPTKGIVSESGSKKGKFYNVILSDNIFDVIKDEFTEEDEEGIDPCENFKVGQKIEDASGNIFTVKSIEGGEIVASLYKTEVKFTCEELQNFIESIKKKKKNENLKIADNLIIEEEEDTTETTSEVEKNIYRGKIYAKDISLGPKAEKRRRGDISAYTSKTKWDGLINSLPKNGSKVKVRLDLDDESSLTPEQKIVFNNIKNILKAESYNGDVLIRKSKTITDGTIFVIEFKMGGKPVALVCEVPKGVNLKKPTKVKIGEKMAGSDVFNKSTNAKITVS